ncbi:MAG: [FeFe] hydrogenase H-cluster radical SAM maturase HydG [Candidatus Margulisiibacteriota bacterium]
MKYIDESKISGILEKTKNVSRSEVEDVLNRSLSLKRLSLEDTAKLLAVEDPDLLDKIFKTAKEVKQRIYGKRIVLFAPLYISNYCSNNCLYCAFRSDNKSIKRTHLDADGIRRQTEILLKKGHKRVLVVAGEAPPKGKSSVDYYVEAINTVYSVRSGSDKIRRININCAPLNVEEFKKLKAAGIGTYQVFQETYHQETYKKVHPKGPKSDPDNRIDAVDRAFAAGVDDVGIGVLYGLYDYKFETLAMLSHVEHLEKAHNVGPHTISIPRIEPAPGVEFTKNIPYEVSDLEFKKVVAAVRLSVPYTGMILSTRETPALRAELLDLGISQISAASRTSPGGYDESEDTGVQFELGDTRTLDEVMDSLVQKGFIPSFCTACYRSSRTGEAFMNLAKPGTIKGKCTMNALITLKEYLDDFSSENVKRKGYEMIKKEKEKLSPDDRKALTGFYEGIDKGLRDEYV